MEPDARTSAALSQCRRHANLWFALALSAMGLAGIVLRAFPPETAVFYPACPFHQWTGLLCPGCGATRALAALAQGRFAEALHCNGLAVAAFGVCAAWLAVAYVRAIRGRQPAWPSIPPPAIAAAIGCALVFAVTRNLT